LFVLERLVISLAIATKLWLAAWSGDFGYFWAKICFFQKSWIEEVAKV
jgi:hypothetical protein